MPTCFEIYETYQRGPAAVLRLFEEALGTRAIYGPPEPDTQQRTIDALSEDIGRLKRQISRLKAALGEARGEVDSTIDSHRHLLRGLMRKLSLP
jgi:hypothetical protein